jgi:hypothetical protein
MSAPTADLESQLQALMRSGDRLRLELDQAQRELAGDLAGQQIARPPAEYQAERRAGSMLVKLRLKGGQLVSVEIEHEDASA